MILLILTLLNHSSLSYAKTVASVNGVSISESDFNTLYQQNLTLYPGRSISKESFLEELIGRELAVQEAKRLKLDESPRAREQIRSVLFQATLETALGDKVSKIQVSDADAKTFYAKYPEIRVSHIFVPVAADASSEEAQSALQKIREIKSRHIDPGKMSFSEVAQRFSMGPEASMGGDLDYRAKDQLEPVLYDSALKLSSVGSVSAPIRSSVGYHVLKLTGKRAWQDANQARIKRLVFEEKQKALVNEYLTSLKSKAKISRSL